MMAHPSCMSLIQLERIGVFWLQSLEEALRELVSRGILKEIGVKTFNYDPVPAVRQHLAELATALASPAKRSEVLAVVLETEKKKR